MMGLIDYTSPVSAELLNLITGNTCQSLLIKTIQITAKVRHSVQEGRTMRSNSLKSEEFTDKSENKPVTLLELLKDKQMEKRLTKGSSKIIDGFGDMKTANFELMKTMLFS